MHHLEGEHTVEAGVDGPVDRGHTADGDARVDAVAAVEHLPDEGVMKGRIHGGEFTSAARPPSRRVRSGGPTAAEL
ncbi:hypothetical protein GCM10010326_46070 [Streptomyces xanthochromogenes]|uniref:Uncharacterized protein n=1 Tax=Streptomyces xanthochromogenes TaxID=67384 RepID=A0ABQ3AGK7_9ACTN|nr:hypothetical protein GCM10010326_46070 [Streptomyces xanthochromogenes]